MTSFNSLTGTLLEFEKPRSTVIFTTHLNGCQFGDAHDISKDLQLNQSVILFPHTDNVHDRNAIGVYALNVDGKWLIDTMRCSRLGWIPAMNLEDRPVKALLHTMLLLGFEFQASLSAFTVRDRRVLNASVVLRRL